jgi:hypothetical protein
MKALIVIILCAVGGFYAYQHFTEAPPAPAPAPNLLPPGEFYTTKRFTEKTEFGVDALSALSMVKRVREEGVVSLVTDVSGREWNVPSEILDNNKDNLERLKKKIPAETRSLADPGASAREAQIAELEREIQRQQLVLDELSLKRKRAEGELAMEASKPLTVSGSPRQGAMEIKQRLNQLDEQKKIAERKIEDANLSIKKAKFNDQALPLAPPRP